MTGYADVQDPVALLNREPDTSGGPTVQDAVKDAGIEVQAVDWVWRKVVGESLVESIIEPITGDFEQIAKQAGQWENVCDALQAVRNNLNAGLHELDPAWTGDAANSFKSLISTQWTVAIEADAQAAKLIGMALNKVADGSKKACDQCLKLIKKLVDKLIEAAAMLPIPVVGWARAVKLVYDGIELYNAIMQLIEGIKAIIEGAQEVINGIKQVGAALAKLKDVRDLNDLVNVANETGEGVATAKGGMDSIKDGFGDVKDGTTSAASAAHSAHSHATAPSHSGDGSQHTGDGSTPNGTTGTSGQNGQRSGNGQKPGNQSPLREDAQNPRDRAQPPEHRCEGREPIDLATGEMYLTQVDVDLPGVLPLALGRVHVSSYTSGRAFGPSWASTMDQRIEVDRDGVLFADPDGVILVYPAPPADGTPVLPAEGARWPLARTGSGYAISQPELGRTLTFPSAVGGTAALESVRDANGNSITFDYDTDRALTAIRHSGGYRVDVVTADRKITELRLAGGPGPVTLVRYGYDERGRLTEVVNSSGAPLRFDYDDADRITKWTDRNGEWYGYTYDDAGRCVRTGGSGEVFSGTLEYDLRARVTRETDSLGNVTAHCFNDHNQLVRRIDPLGNETRYEWDRYDRVLATTDPLGRTTTYHRDERGNVLQLVRPDGSVVTATYDAAGRVLTQTDPDSSVWRREYDDKGNLVAATDAAGATVRYRYHPDGALAELVDAVGNVQRLAVNEAGLPVAVTDATGATTRYERDRFGRVRRIVDPLGAATTYSWTVEGKPLGRSHPDGATETWRYDAEGNELSYVDQAGGVVRTVSTHFDMPAARTAQDGSRLLFDYDTELRPIAVTNQQGMVWRYFYDAIGNLVREVDYDGLERRYERDAAGQVVAVTIGEDRTTLVRDPLGRVVRRESPTGTTTFVYDHAGRVVSAANADARTDLHRDACGRILAETTNGRTITSTFDAAGRRVARRTGTGAESAWAYDGNNRPVSMRAGERSLTFGYDEAGRNVRTLLDTGPSIFQTWDANHRLTGQALTTRAGRLHDRRFSYRADGFLRAADDTTLGIASFDLDPLGRVRATSANGLTEQYAYDPAGNVTNAMPGTPDHPTGGPREYQGTLLRTAGRTRYQYDARGRLVLRQRRRLSKPPQTWRYTWDAEDRLTSVTTPEGHRWHYRYDAFGRRIAKERLAADDTVAERIEFGWDGTLLAEQVDADGHGTVWDHEPGSVRACAQRDRVADAPQDWVDREFFAIVADATGTPTELIGADGVIAWRGRRTLWGETVPARHQTDMPLRFPGQYLDAESGLHYNFERYYDPETARYLTTDPLGIVPTANARAYVPNPLRYIDPFGLTPAPGGAHGPGTGSHTNPPPPRNNGPISMDEAVDLGARHVGGEGRVVTSGSGGYQFISQSTDAQGNRINSIARFDINPNHPHVQNLGPHLNLETQINGDTVESGPYVDPHIPIDPSTIRPGDRP